jgi:hypothetical protein
MLEIYLVVFIIAAIVVFILLAGLLKMVLENSPKKIWMLLISLCLAMALMMALGILIFWHTGKIIAANFAYSETQTKQDNLAKQENLRKRIMLLQSGLSPAELKLIPKDFYTFSGQQNWWRLPLVFPFQIIIVEDFYLGTLEKFSGETVTELNEKSTETITNITKITFDRKFLLCERNILPNNSANKEWGIFEFKTGLCTIFKSERQMLGTAMEKDFEGDFNLHSLLHHYRQSF